MSSSKRTKGSGTAREAPPLTLKAPKRGPGNPVIGPILKVRCPPWILSQVKALAREAGVTVSDAHRDVLRAGLVALQAEGVVAPGFNPGVAHMKALAANEPV